MRDHRATVRPRGLVRLLTVLALLSALSVSVAAGGERVHVSGGGAIVAKLNAQRRANGIPGDLVENPQWSNACMLHNRYEALNNELTHKEIPGRPGYTAEGAWAGENSVLSEGQSWTDENPFESAPIHLSQLLAPSLTAVGADDTDGWVCVTTSELTRTYAADRVYSYPGDGTTGWPASEVAFEDSPTAGEVVGLRAGARTGLDLFVFAGTNDFDAAVSIASASLVGPSGPVEVRWVDSSNETVGEYLPEGGIVIPVKPLASGATYRASVHLSGFSVQDYSWSFTTALERNAVAVAVTKSAGRKVRFTVTSRAAGPTLALTGALKRRIALAHLTGSRYRSGVLRLPAGSYRACATSGGARTGYTAATVCKTFALS